jgi:pilus assembly protein CpaC
MKYAFLFLLLLRLQANALERLTLFSGESRILSVDGPKKILVGNKEVAEARILSDTELLLNGKQSGLSSLVLWGKEGQRNSYEIEVVPSGLKKEMIEIDVQVLELTDANGWDAGIDWPALMNGQIGLPAGTATSPVQALEKSNPPMLAFGTFSRGPIDLVLQALVQKNKGKLLAKPKLLTVSGGDAKFLSGGQVPVVHQDNQGRTNTEYKDYGVTLSIQPKADEEGNINATLRAEVSNIDAGNSITLAGGVFPAVKTRWVQTTIYVKKSGTIVIAGMIQEESRDVTSGIPILSVIPLFGELFKNHHVLNSTSELVIFVTPRVLS